MGDLRAQLAERLTLGVGKVLLVRAVEYRQGTAEEGVGAVSVSLLMVFLLVIRLDTTAEVWPLIWDVRPHVFDGSIETGGHLAAVMRRPVVGTVARGLDEVLVVTVHVPTVVARRPTVDIFEPGSCRRYSRGLIVGTTKAPPGTSNTFEKRRRRPP